jgi:hypothetical protein
MSKRKRGSASSRTSRTSRVRPPRPRKRCPCGAYGYYNAIRAGHTCKVGDVQVKAPTDRGRRQDVERQETYAALRQDGWTLHEIGERYGVTRQAVDQLLRYRSKRTGTETETETSTEVRR